MYDNNTDCKNVTAYMSYEDWENINEDMEKRRGAKKLKEQHKRACYFRRQRRLGAIIMLLGIICLILGSFVLQRVLQGFGVITGFAGLYMMYTNQMIVVDGYYLECQDRINRF